LLLVRKKKRGFTLIELLVVIAIIAILAAILFPVFSRAREQARKTACLSNMKQIGQALMMYVQDWDETFPYTTSCQAPGVGAATDQPQGKLHPYIKNVDVWTCPSEAIYNRESNLSQYGNLAGWPGWPWRFPVEFAGHYISIGYNELLMNNLGCEWTGRPPKMAEVVEPGDTAAFADSYFISTCGGKRVVFANAMWSESVADEQHRSVSKSTRHTEGEIIVYADGHVKWLKWDVIANNCGRIFDPRNKNRTDTWFNYFGNQWWP